MCALSASACGHGRLLLGSNEVCPENDRTGVVKQAKKIGLDVDQFKKVMADDERACSGWSRLEPTPYTP